MYRCPNKKCSNKSIYSDNWVKGCNADGSLSNTCKACNTELSQHIPEKLEQTARINTRGCSGASNPFTH